MQRPILLTVVVVVARFCRLKQHCTFLLGVEGVEPCLQRNTTRHAGRQLSQQQRI